MTSVAVTAAIEAANGSNGSTSADPGRSYPFQNNSGSDHLDSCRRTMSESYVRRTTSYNTDVAHDVVRQARTTVVLHWHRTHTMSYVVHVRHRILMSYVRHVRHHNIRCRSTYDIATYDVVCAYNIVGLTYDIICSHRIRHRMF